MCNFEATSKALISVNIIFQIIVKLVFFTSVHTARQSWNLSEIPLR